MEPYRPAVDRIVRGLAPVLPDMKPPDWKTRLAALGDVPVGMHGQDWTLRSAVGETVRSYARIVDAGKGGLTLPERLGIIGERRRSHAGCVSEDVASRLL